MSRFFQNVLLAQIFCCTLLSYEAVSAEGSDWTVIQPVWDRNSPPSSHEGQPLFLRSDLVRSTSQNSCIVSLAIFTIRGLTLRDLHGNDRNVSAGRIAIVKGERILNGLQAPSEESSSFVLTEATQAVIGFGETEPPFTVSEIREIQATKSARTENQAVFENQLLISRIVDSESGGWFSGLPKIDLFEAVPLIELDDLLRSPPYTVVEIDNESPGCSELLSEFENSLNQNGTNIRFSSQPIEFRM